MQVNARLYKPTQIPTSVHAVNANSYKLTRVQASQQGSIQVNDCLYSSTQFHAL